MDNSNTEFSSTDNSKHDSNGIDASDVSQNSVDLKLSLIHI